MRVMNLIDRRFGRGVVIAYIRRDRPKGSRWLLKCDCGNEYESYAKHLKANDVKSCGCLKSKSLIGQVFGWGTVIAETKERIDRKKVWLLRCKCGNEYTSNTTSLNYGNTKSCGCMRQVLCYGDISGTFYSQIRKGAMERNIEFHLTIQEMYDLFVSQGKCCALTGWALVIQRSAKLHNAGGTTASLDRIDSKKGYVIANVQWVHKDINFMKQAFTNEKFIENCRAVVANVKE